MDQSGYDQRSLILIIYRDMLYLTMRTFYLQPFKKANSLPI